MSTTKQTSFIPMSPELLPCQKLNKVVTVPELPKVLPQKQNGLNAYFVIHLEPHQENSLFCLAQSGLGSQCMTALIMNILTPAEKAGYFGTIGLLMEPDHVAGIGY